MRRIRTRAERPLLAVSLEKAAAFQGGVLIQFRDLRRQTLAAHLAHATVVIGKQENVCRPMREYTDCDDARDSVNPGFHLERIGDL